MSATIEARIRQLLTLDPVCQGQVSGTTVRALALEFAREPEPDSDVLAERAACLLLMGACAERLRALLAAAELEGAASSDPAESVVCSSDLGLELTRLNLASETIALGLHRIAPTPAKGA